MPSDKITRLYINMNTYKAQARTGLLLLKKVVLDLLLDAQSEGVMLQPKEINERIGIPDTGADRSSKTSSLILGVLRHFLWDSVPFFSSLSLLNGMAGSATELSRIKHPARTDIKV